MKTKILYASLMTLLCSYGYSQETPPTSTPNPAYQAPPATTPPPAQAPAPATAVPAAQPKSSGGGGGTEKRLNLYGSYVFDDSFYSSYDSYTYYDGKLKGGFQYGAGLEFVMPSHIAIELLWLGQTTTAPTTWQDGLGLSINNADLDINLNYAMATIGRRARTGDGKIEGTGGLMLGCVFTHAENPRTGTTGDKTSFAWGFRLGGNIWASEKIAIKLHAQILSAPQEIGGSLYFGTGGSGAGVSAYSSFLQFGLGGGIAYRLGR